MSDQQVLTEDLSRFQDVMDATIYTPWRAYLQNGLASLQEGLRPEYENVSLVRAYSSWLIPGMLQTRSYIETIFRSVQEERGLSDDDVERAVQSRLDRKPLMHSGKRTYRFLIEESSLRCGLGGPVVMSEQLEYIENLIASDEVSIGILPMAPDRKRWPEASFWIFDDERVNIELVSGSLNLKHPVDVAEYAARFSQLVAQAEFDWTACQLVRAVRAGLGQA